MFNIDLTNIGNIMVFSNSLLQILLFVIILLCYYPLSKISVYVVNHIFMKLAVRSKSNLDDILVKSLDPTVKMFVLAGVFYIGSNFLNKGNFVDLFDKFFNFLIIVPVVFFLTKFTTEMISYYLKGEKKKTKINEAGIDLLMQIARITLFVIGIILILANLGYDISALIAGLGVGGLAFALAAKDILSNFFAGVSMVFDKTFNKGERVKFEGYSGRIEELKLRSTKIRTYDGTLLTIPNSMLSENIVENVTKIKKVKVSQTFGVTYDTSSLKLQKAKKIIEKAIKDEEMTDKEEFWIWFDNFGPSSLDVCVIYFGKMNMDAWPERVEFKERINFAIKEGFEKAGIEFAFPTQTIELKK